LNLRLLTLTNSYEGELLPDRKFWHVSMGGWRSDEPYGLGLGHQLYWPVYFKKNGVLSWLRFLEKFGHPLPLVRHAEGATDDQKREAFYLAQSLAEDSAAAGSENLTFDLIESSRNGTADYKQLVEVMDAQIAKIILSQGMTTDNGSSRSQAQVHNGVADSVVKSLSDLICESFNKSIVTWWTEFNFPGAKPPQVWRRTEPDTDLKAVADRDKVLFDMGYAPNIDYIVETFGEGFRPSEKGEDAPIALNGAQVTALTNVISQAINDGWIPELAVATIRASFPTIGADVIQAIAEQLQAQSDKLAEASQPQTPLMTPGQAAAQFSEVEPINEARFALLQNLDRAVDAIGVERLGALEYAAAPKKGGKGGKGQAKNCKKGHVCGLTCIAKNRVCKKDATPGQITMKQSQSKKAKGGGGGVTPDPVVQGDGGVFSRVDDLKNLKKEWGQDLETAKKYLPLAELMEKDKVLEDYQKVVAGLADGESVVFFLPSANKKLNGTKEQWAKKLSNERAALKPQIERLGVGLDLQRDVVKISDNFYIIEDAIALSKSKSKKIISGGVKSDGQLQAAYVLSKKKDHLYLEYLAANPASFVGTGVKGAGKAAIIDIVKRSFDEGHSGAVKLMAIPGAAGFYKKMGFTSDNGRDFQLSPGQAKKLLQGG
jgi:hypothetical protein